MGMPFHDGPLETMHTSLQQWHSQMALIVSPDGHSQMSCGHASTDQSPIQSWVSMDQICSAPKNAPFGEFGDQVNYLSAMSRPFMSSIFELGGPMPLGVLRGMYSVRTLLVGGGCQVAFT